MLPSGALLQLWAETCQAKTWRKETWCNIDKNGKQGDAKLETYKWTSTLMTVSVRALNRHIAQSISKCRMKGDIWSKRRRIRPTWDESTESLTPESETNETPKTRSYLYTVCNSCVYIYMYIYIINIKDFDIQVNTRIYLTGFLASSILIIFSCAHGTWVWPFDTCSYLTNFASDNLPLSSDAGWKFRQVGPAVVDAPWLIDWSHKGFEVWLISVTT